MTYEGLTDTAIINLVRELDTMVRHDRIAAVTADDIVRMVAHVTTALRAERAKR